MKRLQTSVRYCEQFVSHMGRADLPRLYLLDGDRSEQDKALLERTASPLTGAPIRIRFLKRYEVENYLLDPEAIATAVTEQLQLYGENGPVITAHDVHVLLDRVLATEDDDVYPLGKDEPVKACKGSVVLARIFESANIAKKSTA